MDRASALVSFRRLAFVAALVAATPIAVVVPAEALWDGTGPCSSATELERHTAAWVAVCFDHREGERYIPQGITLPEGRSIDLIRSACRDEAIGLMPITPNTQAKRIAEIESSRRNLQDRCIVDMSLEVLARTACGAPNSTEGMSVWGAPQFTDGRRLTDPRTDPEGLRTCVGNAKSQKLLRDEPLVRAQCSSLNGYDQLECIDFAYLYGHKLRAQKWSDWKKEIEKIQTPPPRPYASVSKAPPEQRLPHGPCGPGQGSKPDPNGFGRWTCQPLGAFLPPKRGITQPPGVLNQQTGQSSPPSQLQAPFPNVGGPKANVPTSRTELQSPANAPAPPADAQRVLNIIRLPDPLAPIAEGPVRAQPAIPRVAHPQTPVARIPLQAQPPHPRTPQSSIVGPKAPSAKAPTITGVRQDIRSFDAKQGTVVASDGRKINVKPMITALESVSPAAARQPFVASPNGTWRLAPVAQQAIAQQGNKLRGVGGIELDVTFQNLALAGVPDMTISGPRTVIENPVMISLQGLIAATKPYARSQERWRSLPDDIRYPGGIGRVHGYVLDPVAQDIFLVGTPALTREGRIDVDLMTVLVEVTWAKGLTPAVSLDPAPQGSSVVPVTTPLAQGPGNTKARNVDPEPPVHPNTARALDFAGPQHARIINLPEDSLAARILLDADYEMKRISLGVTKVLDADFRSQIDIWKSEPFQTRSSGRRFWFHPIPLNSGAVRVAASGGVVLYDSGVHLLTESVNEAGLGTGEVDPRAVRAAEEFTRAFPRFEASPAVKPAAIFALLHGATDVVTLGKILRDASVNYPVLQEFTKLPYRKLAGAEAAPSTYPGLAAQFQTADGVSGTIRGGVSLQTRSTRRSFDRFDDEVVAVLERVAKEQNNAGFLRRVPITFTLAAQQAQGGAAADLATQAGQRLLAANQPAAAAKRLREATGHDPLNIDAWILLAMAEARSGQQESARAAIAQAQVLDPSDPTARKAATQIEIMGGSKPDPAALDPAVRNDVSSDYVNVALAALGRGDTVAAQEAAAQAIRLSPNSVVAHMARGVIRMMGDDYDATIADFSEVIRLDARNTLAYLFRGMTYGARTNYAAAISDLDRATVLDPKNAMAFKNRGDIHKLSGNFQRAITDYDRTIELEPTYAWAFFNRAVAYEKLGQIDNAVRDYGQTLRLEPNHKYARTFRGALSLRSGAYDQAIKEFDYAISIDPKYELPYSLRGAAYTDRGDPGRAIADYDEAIRLNPNLFPAFFGRGIAYRTQGNLNRAIEDFDGALRLWPRSSMSLVARGNAYRDKGDIDRAIKDYDAAVQLQPKYALAFLNRGVAYVQKGERDRALKDFDSAISLDPQDALPFTNRGLVHSMSGRNDRAVEDFSQAIRLDAQSTRAYAGRSEALRQLGKLDQALSDGNDAVRIGKSAFAFQARGRAFYEKKEYDRAIEDHSEAIRLEPATAAYFVNRADAFRGKRELDRAIGDYSEAIRLSPEPSSHFKRGNAYLESKSFDRAIADYTEVLRVLPQHAEAHAARANAYGSKGDFVRAIADLGETLRINPRDHSRFYMRGLYYMEREDFDRAIADFSEAIRLAPDHIRYHARGSAYSRKNDSDRAIADYSDAIRLRPDFTEALYNRALLYLRKDAHQRAVADFTEVIRLSPRVEAYIGRGSAHYLTRDYDRSIADFSEAIRIQPRSARGYRMRSQVYRDKGDIERANSDLREANLLGNSR